MQLYLVERFSMGSNLSTRLLFDRNRNRYMNLATRIGNPKTIEYLNLNPLDSTPNLWSTVRVGAERAFLRFQCLPVER